MALQKGRWAELALRASTRQAQLQGERAQREDEPQPMALVSRQQAAVQGG